MTTQEMIDGLREAALKMSLGRWRGGYCGRMPVGEFDWITATNEEDLKHISWLRNNASAIADELERLRAENERLRHQLMMRKESDRG